MDAGSTGTSDGPIRWSRTTRFVWSLDGEAEYGAGGRRMLARTGGPSPRGALRLAQRPGHHDEVEHRLIVREVATRDQRGDQIFFDPLGSALSLRITCEVSPSIVALPAAYFTAHFLILDARTRGIVAHERWYGRMEWGESFWIAMGNHWGPAGYDAPVDWGLRPARPGGSDVFGFRAAMTAEAWVGEHGMQPLCAYDVSPIAWFRVGARQAPPESSFL